MSQLLRSCLFIVLSAVMSGSAFAQIEQARLNGLVTDAQGAVLPGVDTVPILDLRIDKTLVFSKRYKAAIMLDAYNLLNSNAVSNFNITNGTQFNRIIATLDPRTVQLGLRFEF